MSRFRLPDLFNNRRQHSLRKKGRSIAHSRGRKLLLEDLEGRWLLAADLLLTKSDNLDPVAPGNTITYTISVTNNGPDEATSLTLLDFVPANTTFVSFAAPVGWTANTPAVGGTGPVTVTGASLANGATANFQMIVQVGASTPLDTTITNTAIVASQVDDTNTDNNTDTESTLVQIAATADLEVVKTDSPDPVVAGANVTYTITVRNVGSADALNVELTDVVPTGTTFVSMVQATGPAFTLSLPAVGGTGTASGTIGTLAAGAEATFTTVVNVNSNVLNGATISNTSAVATTSADANLGNNTDTETTTVSAQADVSVTKTDSPDPVVAGANLTYSITVSNSGASDAQNVELSDLVPSGATFVSLLQSAGPAFTLSTPPVGGTGTATATIGTLAAGASATFTLVINVNANVLAGGTVSNTAAVVTTTADVNAANNSDTEVTDVLAQADLSVTKTESPDPVLAGGNLTYTITISNAGTSDAQSVILTDVIPTNTTFVSLTAPAGWTLTTPAPGGTGTATATLPTLAAGANATFTLVVQVDATATGTIGNTAAISSATTEINVANNSDSEDTTIQVATGAEVDLVVTKVDAPDPVVAGTNVSYTVTVTNASANEAANVVLTDVVPAGSTFVSLTSPVGWTATTPAVGGTGTATASIATLAAGATATFTFVVNVNANVPDGAILSNTAAVATTSTDVNLANNSDTESTTVDTSADVSVTKSDSPDPVAAGANLTYTVILANSGPSDALSVSLSDVVPVNTTFVSLAQTAGPAFTIATPSVGGTGTTTASIAVLPAGASATFTLVVAVGANVAAGATITNTAAAVTTTADGNTANNSDTETTSVVTRADLSVTKTDLPEPVVAGTNLTYTVVVTNNGPSAAAAVQLSEAVPANATFVSLTAPAGWTSVAPAPGGTGAITASIPSLAAGASATFTLVVAVNSAATGTISNTATVSSNTTDLNAANNTDVESTVVLPLQDGIDDFGDAPDSYGTLLASDGPRHTLGSGLFLGAAVDADADGQPSVDALGDDTDLDGDDEDGLLLGGGLVAGACTTTTVTVSGDGFLDAWIDFDGSGTFDDDERIADSLFVTAGSNELAFATPADAVGGTTYARFRISSTGGLSPTGPAADGEVEDYQLEIIEILPGTARLVDDPNNPGARMLVVVGTNKNDHILIEPRPSNKTQVRVKNTGKLMGIFDSSEISSIVALGLAGNDVIVVDHRLNIPAEICGGSGNDKLFGGGGDDLLWGEDSNDKLYGGRGNDTLLGGTGNDFAFGGHGNDLLLGEAGIDKLYGEAGNDSLLGGSANDFLYGGAGNDMLQGEEGNDKLYGEAGHDILLGGLGSDVMHGGSGRDLVIGGEGRDKVYGDGDDDILIGGTTDFDADETALLEIMAEWSSSASFDTRIANLEAFLNDGTVFDDGEIDDLSGTAGRDWYLDFALADKRLGFSANSQTGDRRN
jgi:uncharacterized repeat protein (TIGR01451 family)